MEAATSTARSFSEVRHELARTGLGGSDAAAVLGLSKYQTPLDVWMAATGRSGPGEQSEAAEWGQRLESEVLRKYAEELAEDELLIGRDREGRIAQYRPDGDSVVIEVLTNGDPVQRAFGHLLDTLRHPTRPHLMAHLDALVIGSNDGFRSHFEVRRLVDAKTAGHWASKDWGEEGTDETPEDYIVQAHDYAGILAALGHPVPQADIPALFAGQQYRLFHVPISVTLCRRVHDRLDEWWITHVEGDVMPDVSSRDNRTLGSVFPEDDGESIFAPAETFDFARALGEYRDAEKEAKEGRSACEAQIKAAMGEAAEMVGEGWRVTWKRTKDSVKVDHEAALDALRTSLEVRGLTDVIALLDECIEDMTETKPGYRRLLTYGLAKSAKEGDE